LSSILSKILHSVKPDVLAVVLPKIIILWGKTVCQYASSSRLWEAAVLHIQGQAVQGEQPCKEKRIISILW